MPLSRSFLPMIAFMVLSAVVRPVAASDAPSANQRAEVQQLLRQLDDNDPAKQASASAALMKLGPTILPLLEEDARWPDTLKHRVKTVRSSLRDAAVAQQLRPHLIDLPAMAHWKDALADIEKQAGIHVNDGRQQQTDDPELKLDVHHAPFWQALDAVAREADARVYLYHQEVPISLVDGPYVAVPTSYHGLFRSQVTRVTCMQDLEGSAHFCDVLVEIAWEPRFRPLFLEAKPESLEVRDSDGNMLEDLNSSTGRIPVGRPGVVRTQLRFQAPPRKTKKIDSLKATLAMIGPGEMLAFTIDTLPISSDQKPAPPVRKTDQGVTFALRQFTAEPERWTAVIELEYPSDTPDFESFESWLVNNSIVLQKKTGAGHLSANGGYSIDEQTGHHAVITYHFVEEENVKLGKPEEWKLVYRTPGTMVKLRVPLEFKDLPLP